MARQTGGDGSLALTTGHRLYSGADYFRQVSRFENDEGGQRDAILRQRFADDCRNHEPKPKNHHHERHAAKKLNVDCRRKMNPTRTRQTCEADEDSEYES